MRDWAYDYLEGVLQQTGWTMNGLASRVGVAASTINRPMRDKQYSGQMSRATLRKIMEISGVDPAPYAPASELALLTGPLAAMAEGPRGFQPAPAPTLSLHSGQDQFVISIAGGRAQITADVGPHGIAKLREKLDLLELLLKD